MFHFSKFIFKIRNRKYDIVIDVYNNLIRLLSLCDMIIGNEGSVINMGKIIDIPTFSLFSPSIDKESRQLFEKENVSIHLKDLNPKIYEQYNTKYIKENTFKYYEEYPLNIIIKKLENYFKSLNFIK